DDALRSQRQRYARQFQRQGRPHAIHCGAAKSVALRGEPRHGEPERTSPARRNRQLENRLDETGFSRSGNDNCYTLSQRRNESPSPQPALTLTYTIVVLSLSKDHCRPELVEGPLSS